MPLIKRYPNRKLYNTDSKQYITLDELAELIRAGDTVQVVDHKTGEDMTSVILTQIIAEREKKQNGFLPTSVLTSLIQSGGDTISTLRQSLFNPLQIVHHADELIEKRLEQLGSMGKLTAAEVARLRTALMPSEPSPESRPPFNEADIEQILRAEGVPTGEEFQQLLHQLTALTTELNELID